MRKRIVLVYNPYSSHYKKIKKKVLNSAEKLDNFDVFEFEVEKIALEKNAENLSSILKTGDLVIVAGGDGTATMALNAIFMSKKERICFGVLGFGNFNDIAASIGNENLEDIVNRFGADEVHEVWPLECYLDGKLWRYGIGYFTVGMMADSCDTFEESRIRRKLKIGKIGRWYSAWKLFGWWRKNRGRKFLPNNFKINNKEFTSKSDILVLNGRRMAHFIKGTNNFAKPEGFKYFCDDLRRFPKIMSFMLRSMTFGMPGRSEKSISINFPEITKVKIQGEGEILENELKNIEIRKSRKSIMVTGWGTRER